MLVHNPTNLAACSHKAALEACTGLAEANKHGSGTITAESDFRDFYVTTSLPLSQMFVCGCCVDLLHLSAVSREGRIFGCGSCARGPTLPARRRCDPFWRDYPRQASHNPRPAIPALLPVYDRLSTREKPMTDDDKARLSDLTGEFLLTLSA